MRMHWEEIHTTVTEFGSKFAMRTEDTKEVNKTKQNKQDNV